MDVSRLFVPDSPGGPLCPRQAEVAGPVQAGSRRNSGDGCVRVVHHSEEIPVVGEGILVWIIWCIVGSTSFNEYDVVSLIYMSGINN